MRWVGLTVLSLVIVGCTGSSTPATTPTSVATTSSTTTTTLDVTTTVDRLTEIEAIYRDLEERRLDALYRGDREAYRALFANEAYLEASLGVMDETSFIGAPQNLTLEVREVLVDRPDCIAAVVYRDLRSVLGEEAVGERIIVLQSASETWGLSFIGEGWLCDGPHPLDS